MNDDPQRAVTNHPPIASGGREEIRNPLRFFVWLTEDVYKRQGY